MHPSSSYSSKLQLKARSNTKAMLRAWMRALGTIGAISVLEIRAMSWTRPKSVASTTQFWTMTTQTFIGHSSLPRCRRRLIDHQWVAIRDRVPRRILSRAAPVSPASLRWAARALCATSVVVIHRQARLSSRQAWTSKCSRPRGQSPESVSHRLAQ